MVSHICQDPVVPHAKVLRFRLSRSCSCLVMGKNSIIIMQRFHVISHEKGFMRKEVSAAQLQLRHELTHVEPGSRGLFKIAH